MAVAKRVGLIPAALLILAALSPSLASASEFGGSDFPATISGKTSGAHTFTVEGGFKLKCTGASFSGEAYEPAETLTLTPAYSGCTFAGVATTVNVEGCAYVLHSGAEATETTFSGTLDVTCPTGKSIGFTAAGCEVQVGAQSGLGTVEYSDTSESGVETITVAINLKSVKYKKSKDEGACPLSGTGEKEDGAYAGTAILSGTWASEAVGLEVQGAKVKTKLCQEAAKPSCKTIYKAATTVTASDKFPAQAKAYLELGTKVECSDSTISAKTKEDEGNPKLKLENVSIAFPTCETAGGTKCGEVKTLNMTGSGTLMSAGLDGNGRLEFAVPTLKIVCGAAYDCRYGLNSVQVRVEGGNPAFIKPTRESFEKQAFAGEVNCTPRMYWLGSYEVSAPKPVWVGS